MRERGTLVHIHRQPGHQTLHMMKRSDAGWISLCGMTRLPHTPITGSRSAVTCQGCKITVYWLEGRSEEMT